MRGILRESRLALVILVCVCGSVSAQQPPARIEVDVVREYQGARERFRDLRWEQLAETLERPEFAPEGLRTDPREADFFELIQRELKLGDDAVEKVERQGLALIDPGDKRPFPAVYYDLYTRDLPLLITTDSILHAFHHSYDRLMTELEMTVILPRLADLLEGAHRQLESANAAGIDEELRSSYADVDLYLTVARNLLSGSGFASRGVQPIVAERGGVASLLGAIERASEASKRELYGKQRWIDFTQFKPRGHYTRSAKLQNYFRCLSWLGRADCGWYVPGAPGATGAAAGSLRELRNAVLLNQLVAASGKRQKWDEIDRTLRVLVGAPDNLTLEQLDPFCEQAGLTTAGALRDAEKLANLSDSLQQRGAAGQAIRSQILEPNNAGGRPAAAPRLFQLFGQRFLLDSFVLSQVVHDAIEFQGERPPRMMPRGMDVMAALGNDLALELLAPEIERWGYAGNMAALRQATESAARGEWHESLRGGWLHSLRRLDRDLTGTTTLPRMFRTRAWQLKQLQTQLASWSELRHDTILYAKASYSVPQCEVPAAFVEPYPEFFGELGRLAERSAEMLDGLVPVKPQNPRARGPFGAYDLTNDVSPVQFFERMASHMRTLESIATRQLRGEAISREEELFLQRIVSQKGNMLFGSGFFEAKTYDGWYPQLMYGFVEEDQDLWRATIADVHTDIQAGTCLEVGVGRVNLCVTVLEIGGRPTAFVGPVYSYYEFTQPIAERLTDSEWQQMLNSGNAPARPAFIEPLVVSETAKSDPLVTAERAGTRMKVTRYVDDPYRERGTTRSFVLDKQGLADLAAFAPGVRSLDLSGLEIDDTALESLQGLENLKAVNLSGTKIEGQGLAHLAKSSFLRRLDLSDTLVGDDHLRTLADWKYLEELDLSGTTVTSAGVEPLRRLYYLRQLDLRGTEMNEAAVERLRRTLRRCEVLAD